jgi:signal transduction histidine kinase
VDREAVGPATGDLLLRPVLRPLAAAVGAFYLGLAGAALLLEPLRRHPVMVAAWAAGGLLLLALAGTLPAWRPRHAERVGLLVALAVAAEGVLLLAVTREPAMTVVLEISLLGSALVLYSRRHQAIATCATLAGWAGVAAAAGGERWLFWGITLVAVAALAGLAQHARLTAHRHLEALRQAELSRLEARQTGRRRQQEAEFKAAFLQMAAHELSTPLTPLLLQTRILRMLGDGGDPRRARSIESVDRSARRLQAIVEDMLDVIRYQSGTYLLERREVDLARLAAQEVAARAEDARHKGIEVTHAPEEGVVAQVDGDRIREAVRKLLDNALKFTPEGGRIELRAEAVGDEVRLRVSDNGPGLGRDQTQRLFEAFTQVEMHSARPHAGPGLGLAVARLAALAHGGRLEYAPRTGGGSSFTLVLPARFKAPAEVPPA